MRYVMARLEQELREVTYRYYITDSLYATGNNQRLTKRFVDIIEGRVKPPDNRSGEEIAEDIITKHGLILKE